MLERCARYAWYMAIQFRITAGPAMQSTSPRRSHSCPRICMPQKGGGSPCNICTVRAVKASSRKRICPWPMRRKSKRAGEPYYATIYQSHLTKTTSTKTRQHSPIHQPTERLQPIHVPVQYSTLESTIIYNTSITNAALALLFSSILLPLCPVGLLGN